MKIIDFERKCNLVRFYLGKQSCNDYWGDNWDDVPYECNAGIVYDEYVSGIRDIVFPFNSLVLEPADSYNAYSDYSKEEMKNREVPCIIVVPPELTETNWRVDFDFWITQDNVLKFYFGDKMYPSRTIKTWDFT